MSAQPVHVPDPEDPASPRAILARLPEHMRPEFLRGYEAALNTARTDLDSYRAPQLLLRRWSTLADHMADPAFWDALHDAQDGRGEPADFYEAITAERARR